MLTEQEIEFLQKEIEKIENDDVFLTQEEAIDTKAKKVNVYLDNKIIATLHLNNYFYKILEKNIKNEKIRLVKHE